MSDYIEGKDLDVQSLLAEAPRPTELSIFTVRNKDLHKLHRLDELPLKILGLRWISAPDLREVPLPKSLTDIAIWHCSKLRSLEGLEQAPNLKSLVLEDNAPLENSGAIGTLKKLETLYIQGGMVSLQKINNLDAIEGLPIKLLGVRGIQGSHIDLSPVARLPYLRELDIHGPNFRPEELAKVAAAHPWFLDQLLDLADYKLGGMRCKNCNGLQKQMFLRRKKFLRCPKCDASEIQKAIDGFLQLVEQAHRLN